MENYLVINGKRVDLTEEQIEQLGLEVKKKSPFARAEGENYFSISNDGKVKKYFNGTHYPAIYNYMVANYCTDKEIMTARAKEEVLSRLLWRFSMENGGDKIDWENEKQLKYTFYKTNNNIWEIAHNEYCFFLGIVFFISQEIAQRAIDEIVKPFYAGELEVCKIWEE